MSPSTNDLELRRQVQALTDIENIKQLAARYYRCLDTANMTEMRELMTEDVTTDFHGGSYHVQLEGRDAYLEMIASVFNAEFIGHHNVHHPEIELVSETEAKATWYLADIAINLRTMRNTYGTALRRDRYRKVEGQWKICHAGYSRIFEVEEEVKPMNLTAHYLGLHGRKVP